MVIISHSDFLETLGPLKKFRESQGLSVALIDVEDLYDEFSYGNKTPQALRDFLLRASLIGKNLHVLCCWWEMPALIPAIT